MTTPGEAWDAYIAYCDQFHAACIEAFKDYEELGYKNPESAYALTADVMTAELARAYKRYVVASGSAAARKKTVPVASRAHSAPAGGLGRGQ